MAQLDEQNIKFCMNCDAEYTISRIDDDSEEPEYCPFCGHHLEEEELEEEDLIFDEFDDEL